MLLKDSVSVDLKKTKVLIDMPPPTNKMGSLTFLRYYELFRYVLTSNHRGMLTTVKIDISKG